MATTLHLTRTLRGFEPADDASREAMLKWKPGTAVKGQISVPRDYASDLARLRWWWQLCTIIAENAPEGYWPTKEAASDSLKLGIGIFETFIEKDAARGVWVERRKPGSIALDSKAMDDGEFRAFCIRAQNYVCTDMLVGTDADDLAGALEAYLNPDPRRAA